MKRSIRAALTTAALTCAFAPLPAAAQNYAVDRGSWILGGSAGLTSEGFDSDLPAEDSDRDTRIFIAPMVQYFFSPGLALGGRVSLSYRTGNDRDTFAYGIGPAVTYYFGRGQRTAYPYVGASFGIFKTDTDSEGPLGDSDLTSTSYGGQAGVLFMLSSAVGVTTELFYSRLETDSGSFDSSSDSYGIAVGVSAFIF